MANWNKLTAKLNKVLNSITDEEWDKWMREREQKKIERIKNITKKLK